jgi:hypothetical protein
MPLPPPVPGLFFNRTHTLSHPHTPTIPTSIPAHSMPGVTIGPSLGVTVLVCYSYVNPPSGFATRPSLPDCRTEALLKVPFRSAGWGVAPSAVAEKEVVVRLLFDVKKGRGGGPVARTESIGPLRSLLLLPPPPPPFFYIVSQSLPLAVRTHMHIRTHTHTWIGVCLGADQGAILCH